MNDEVLRRLAEEVAKQNVLYNWPFYVVLLAVSFIGITLGSYLRARMAKRGEIAATKADMEEIMQQLVANTNATESVKLSLGRGDWMQRETNVLKRTKLEQLLTSAFAISTWTNEDARASATGRDAPEDCPIDEFEMLANLYFPELRDATSNVERLFRHALVQSGTIRIEMAQISHELELASRQADRENFQALLSRRAQAYEEYRDPVLRNALAVYQAVSQLSVAARGVMAQLTDPATA